MTNDKLRRSKDRKVANLVNSTGKAAVIANTFGLPSGKAFSCPGATSVCKQICYAGKLEKVYKGVRDVLMHNFSLLQHASREVMRDLIHEMITEFEVDCEKRDAEKLFRIHWDGDFFNEEYTLAWRDVIVQHSGVRFWVYTRSDFAVHILSGVENLGLYFSTDSDNFETAKVLSQTTGVKLAYLANTFEEGKAGMRQVTSKSGVPCPENNRKLALISKQGSACVTCGQCVFARNDILFSASKK